MYQYYTDSIPQALLAAIFAVSLNLTTTSQPMTESPHEAADMYAAFVKRTLSPILLLDTAATITDLRTMFLLALFTFRNNRSRKAWALTAQLVQLAYQYGLHQIDNPINCSFYNAETTTAEELEGWRYLWWNIFILDCCCHATVATPSTIDLDSLCTALPSGTIADWTKGKNIVAPEKRTFLYDDLEALSSLLQSVSREWSNGVRGSGVDVNFIVRVINASQIREVCSLFRAIDQNPTRNFDRRWKQLSISTAALRLALPPRYLNPQCLASSGESRRSHTLRIVNLFEIYLCNMLMSMPKEISQMNTDAEFSHDLDVCITYVERIVEVCSNWDSGMCSQTDPAVGFIVFIAMVMVHIEQKLDGKFNRSQKQDQSNSSFQLMRLFLQQLGQKWHLAQTLVGRLLLPPVDLSGVLLDLPLTATQMQLTDSETQPSHPFPEKTRGKCCKAYEGH